MERIPTRVTGILRAAAFVIAAALVFGLSGRAASAPGDDVADRVFGQGGSFTTNTCNNGGVSAATVCGPRGMAVDNAGNLYLADSANNRVLQYNTPLATDTIADRVFGQLGSFTATLANNGGISASSLFQPTAVALDAAGNIYIADYANHRVLEYNNPLTTDTVADQVFGQGGSFTANTLNNGGISASSLAIPTGVAVDGSGRLYIADNFNNRVLVYNSPLSSDTVADHVFGQTGSFTTNTCNNGGVSAATLCRPGGVMLDGSGNLYVADGGDPNMLNPTGNNRVLEYDSPLTTNTVADRVFGQVGSFTTNTCNNGGISASSLCRPNSIALDAAGNLYVSDGTPDLGGVANQRVLEFNNPLTTDMGADRVFGQGGSFTTNTCHSGGVTASSLCHPYAVALDASGNLYVAASSRVLEYDTPLTPAPPNANIDTTIPFSLSSPNPLASNLHADAADVGIALGTAFTDASFAIANDAALANGATLGNVDILGAFGIANSACNSAIALSIPLREADTSTTDTITPAGPPNDPFLNLVQDNRGANPGDPANGLPDYVDATPGFNNPVFTMTGGGPVTPRARYAGHALIAGSANLVVQVVVFEPGALTGLPNGGWSAQALGYPTVPIVADPTRGPLNTTTVTDMCSPLSSTILLCGRTDSAPATPGCQTNASSQTRVTSPAGPRTVQTIVQAKSLRDHDGDGIENQLDPCPTTNSSAWDPRAPGGAADNEFGSGDGLPNDCDPAPAVFNNDQDADGWQNRIDNCALVANGTAAAQLDQDIASNQPVPDGGPRSDGIGAACDPDAASPNGAYRRTAQVNRSCITANASIDDTDGDGVCETGPTGTTVDPNDGITDSDADGVGDRTDDCIGLANPPAGGRQTDYDMDGLGDVCDGDRDGDGWTDAAESGVGNIGTDALDPCADNSSDNAWPPDLDNDGFADISDISFLTGQFSQSVPPAPARHDIAPDTIDSPPGPDNFIDITDISRITGLFGASCGILWGRTTGPP